MLRFSCVQITYRCHKYDLYILVGSSIEMIQLVHRICRSLHSDMDSVYKHHLVRWQTRRTIMSKTKTLLQMLVLQMQKTFFFVVVSANVQTLTDLTGKSMKSWTALTRKT